MKRTVASLSRLERAWLKGRYCGWCEAPALGSTCYARSDLGPPCDMDEQRAQALKGYKPRKRKAPRRAAGSDLTLAELQTVLRYDPATGEFRHAGGFRKGQVAGCIAKGYRIINTFGRRLRAHRLAWLFTHGEWPKGEIDHINGIRSDNRIANLRDTDHSGNQQNVFRPRRDNASGFRGVSKAGGGSKRYTARMWRGGKRIIIGDFDNPEEAGAAYLAAKRSHVEGLLRAD